MFKNTVAKLMEAGRFEIFEETIDKISDDKILVKNEVCGVCQGTEIWFWRGKDCNTGEKPDYPVILGHQNAGKVVAVGKNVKGIKVDEIYTGLGIGGYQAYSEADPSQCCRVPDGVSCEEATQALEWASIIKEVDAAKISTRDKVVIIGAGPMGNLLMQMVRLRAPQMLIVTDLHEARLQYARELGATHTICASKEDQVEVVNEITEGGASVVFEATCSVACLKLAIQMLKPESKLVIFGTHPEPINIKADVFKRKSCTAYFTFPIGSAEWIFYAQRGLEVLQTGSIKITPLITHRFGLNQLNEAFELIETKIPDIMKIMINPQI